MTGKGITIKRLLATGESVDPAGVDFAAGLNVIAYMSQTGKSYILECIDFMLGGQTPPRNIQQSEGYDTLWLEISDMAGQTYVLKRALIGGGYRLYRIPLANIRDNSPWTPLAATKKAKTSAAGFIMGLCGFPNAELKSNQSNAKAALSFRTISHFFIVNEISMIDDPSPIHTRAGFAVTIERSAFKFLLTGQDDSALETVAANTPGELPETIRREVYDELISQLESELAQVRTDDGPQAARLDELEQRLAATSAEIADTSAQIRQQEAARQERWLSRQEAESRIIVLNELLARFVLLRSHYESDLRRLEFIADGKHYVDQLEAIACPLCGAALASDDPEPSGDGNALTVTSVEGAYAKEAEKIRLHMGDLEGTVGTVRTEHAEVAARSGALMEQLGEIDQHLKDHLAPKMATARAQVQELIEDRSRLMYIKTVEARVSALREVRAALGEEMGEETATPDERVHTGVYINDKAILDFCAVMRGLLERWHFLPRAKTLTFDTGKFDFVLDGQARRNNGKGVRAIIHAAFNIALMRYCLAKNLPHARFVVLDSPLTTFKEPRQNVRADAIDEVPGEVQTAFFEDLANAKVDEQIIVIENKQPPPSIAGRSTYTQFVGYEIPGRAGFFPAGKSA